MTDHEALRCQTAVIVNGWLALRPVNTRRAYENAIVALGRWLDGLDMLDAAAVLFACTKDQADELARQWAETESEHYQRATVAARLSILRSLTVYARDAAHIGWTLACELPPDLRRSGRDVSGPPEIAIRCLLEVLRENRNTVTGARDECLFALFFYQALRRAEVAWMQVSDVDLEARIALAPRKGRSNKEPVLLAPASCAAIENWLQFHPDPQSERPLVPSRRDSARPLTPDGMHYIFQNTYRALVAERAGLIRDTFSFAPNAFRHASITKLAALGMDGRSIRAFARHESLGSTADYIDEWPDPGGGCADVVSEAFMPDGDDSP